MKRFIKQIIPSMIGSVITVGIFLALGVFQGQKEYIHSDNSIPLHKASYTVNEDGALIPLDFTKVSRDVMQSVVHVTSTRKVATGNKYYFRDENPFKEFFGDDFFKYFYQEPQQGKKFRSEPDMMLQSGTGSGVIFNEDGYIITNNHVIDGAEEVEVTLHNNKTYRAKIVGADPSTDIAVLQIKEKNLPALPIGNSDQVEVGEWVLAIGNPYNLDATVTAGIVSAKGRNINIIDDKTAIEAFIQTDAAINPGNSGGALVDLHGELIGINTAIASPTGAYTGYGFAIPSSIVSKVVNDIMDYGMVQRAFLGVMIRDINASLMDQENLKISEGAYVDSVNFKSAAEKAGIQPGDIIVSLGDRPITKSADLLEQVGTHKPGDQVSVTINRKGKEIRMDVTLANKSGSEKIIARNDAGVMDLLGATFKTLDREQARELDLKGGVIIEEINNGILRHETNLEEGFIITGVNSEEVTSVDELEKALKKENGGVMLEGIYPNYPGKIYVAFGLPG